MRYTCNGISRNDLNSFDSSSILYCIRLIKQSHSSKFATSSSINSSSSCISPRAPNLCRSLAISNYERTAHVIIQNTKHDLFSLDLDKYMHTMLEVIR